MNLLTYLFRLMGACGGKLILGVWKPLKFVKLSDTTESSQLLVAERSPLTDSGTQGGIKGKGSVKVFSSHSTTESFEL